MKRQVLAVVLGSLLAVGAAACGDGAEDEGEPATEVAGGRCEIGADDPSMYRVWNDAALDAIRLDFPAPTVHARNLFHLSATLYDIWVAFSDSSARAALVDARASADDIDGARDEAMAFAAHHLLTERYQLSLARPETVLALNNTLNRVCGVIDSASVTDSEPDSAAAFGVDIAEQVLALTLDDGSLERKAYEDTSYEPVNTAMKVDEPGTELADPDRWQPLLLETALSQNGLPLPGGEQTFIGSNWGDVRGFALSDGPPSEGATTAPIDDPGPPPRIADAATAEAYRAGAVDVVRAGADLEVGATTIDIGPGAYGNNSLGVDDGDGHETNPATGDDYEPNVVDAADYYRVIAEYWADGPTSETPPGHWNSLANEVSDSMSDDDRRLDGQGEPVSRLEWDVKLGLAVNGALHDAAISAWGIKAFYDSVRPISMIRWLGGNGAFDAETNPNGLPLEDGLIEVVTDSSSAPGERHEHLAEHVGEVAVRSWAGSPDDPENEVAGVAWIRAVEWVPYQRATFVTPAFASYVSGHSTFSRAAAEVLSGLTGTAFFPDGMGTHTVSAGALLHEEGPSVDLELQWATYFDAADEAGRSRIWGGIHILPDDRAGREVGSQVGIAALERARTLFN